MSANGGVWQGLGHPGWWAEACRCPTKPTGGLVVCWSSSRHALASRTACRCAWARPKASASRKPGITKGSQRGHREVTKRSQGGGAPDGRLAVCTRAASPEPEPGRGHSHHTPHDDCALNSTHTSIKAMVLLQDGSDRSEKQSAKKKKRIPPSFKQAFA